MFTVLVLTQPVIFALTMWVWLRHTKTGKLKSLFRVLVFCLFILTAATITIMLKGQSDYPPDYVTLSHLSPDSTETRLASR